MIDTTAEPEQRSAARVAGLLYLIMMFTALFGELYFRSPRIVPDDAVQTARNIAAAGTLFRLSIVFGLLTAAGDVILLWALYVVLKPVNKNLALLAAFWRLVECAMFGVVALNEFAALRFLSDASYLRAFNTEQLQALSRLFLTFHHPGGQIAIVFFGLGSTLFAYLWFKSRYIPRVLSAVGIVASLAVGAVTLITLVVPSFESAVAPAYWIPIALFEVILGFWLLIRGIRIPQQA